ncbi:unnamed protein product [Calypogeia fissa]
MSSNTGHSGSDKAMLRKMAATLVFLCMVLQAPAVCSARFTTMHLHGHQKTPRRRSLLVDLMHVHHVDSPYLQADLTISKRVQMAVQSSKQRVNFFASKIAGQQPALLGVENPYSAPIYSTQGAYVMQLSIGTPPRIFSAIADTGSDLVWLQCAPCTQCFKQPDPVFDPSKSSTYNQVGCKGTLCEKLPASAHSCSPNNTCSYEYTYGDASNTKGDLAAESITLTSSDGSTLSFPNVHFGCGTENKGIFQKTDGLIGLGRGDLSLMSQLGPKFGNVFSYCLVDFFSATTRTSPMHLGGTGTDGLTYTPLVQNGQAKTFYYVNLVGITVNGQAINFPPDTFTINGKGKGGMVLDSGTTVTHMFDMAYIPFKEAISANITYPSADGTGSGLELCYNLKGIFQPVFPEVVFQFEDLELKLPTGNTFVAIDDKNTTCLAFGGIPASTADAISIFGNIQQQNFHVTYDLANNRVGFAPTKSACSW